MASAETEISVSVVGLDEPIREIKAAAESVANSIIVNRKIAWAMLMLTLLNLTTLFAGDWAEAHTLELIISTVVVIVAFLFAVRRKTHQKEN